MIIIFEIGVGAAGFVKRKELGDALDHGFNKTLTRYEDNKLAWKLLQHEVKLEEFICVFFLFQSIEFPLLQFTCCGINGPDDWQPIFHNSTLPSGCCTGPTDEGKCIRTDKEHVNEVGCKSKLLDFLDRKSLIFGAVGLAVALIQVSCSNRNYFCCVRLSRAILLSDHWPRVCLLSVQSLPQKL